MGKDLTILLVDDEPSVLRTTALVLEHSGYSVVTAATAEAALRLLNSNFFDLLLLDGIPDRELVVQEAKRLFSPPMIALYLGNSDLSDLSQLNVDTIIQKPISPPVFLAQIAEVLEAGNEQSFKVLEAGNEQLAQELLTAADLEREAIRRRLLVIAHNYSHKIKCLVNDLNAELEHELEALLNAFDKTIVCEALKEYDPFSMLTGEAEQIASKLMA